MKLSKPIHRLKKEARRKARDTGTSLHLMLDSLARAEGYSAWGHLSASHRPDPARSLFAQLAPGDLVLLAAQRGRGKTLLALELMLAAVASGAPACIFSAEETSQRIQYRLSALGASRAQVQQIAIDCFDAINADRIMAQLNALPPGTMAVIDYLQALDIDRKTPPLAAQIAALKRFAIDRHVVLVFLSQIARRYDPTNQRFPSLADIRLFNPLDLGLFDKAIFLNEEAAHLEVVSPGKG